MHGRALGPGAIEPVKVQDRQVADGRTNEPPSPTCRPEADPCRGSSRLRPPRDFASSCLARSSSFSREAGGCGLRSHLRRGPRDGDRIRIRIRIHPVRVATASAARPNGTGRHPPARLRGARRLRLARAWSTTTPCFSLSSGCWGRTVRLAGGYYCRGHMFHVPLSNRSKHRAPRSALLVP